MDTDFHQSHNYCKTGAFIHSSRFLVASMERQRRQLCSDNEAVNFRQVWTTNKESKRTQIETQNRRDEVDEQQYGSSDSKHLAFGVWPRRHIVCKKYHSKLNNGLWNNNNDETKLRLSYECAANEATEMSSSVDERYERSIVTTIYITTWIKANLLSMAFVSLHLQRISTRWAPISAHSAADAPTLSFGCLISPDNKQPPIVPKTYSSIVLAMPGLAVRCNAKSKLSPSVQKQVHETATWQSQLQTKIDFKTGVLTHEVTTAKWNATDDTLSRTSTVEKRRVQTSLSDTGLHRLRRLLRCATRRFNE